MTTKLLIDRELLERIDETAICDGMDATISDDLFTRLVAALAAPRQPEGEGLEVVASQFPEINFSNYGQDEVEALQAWGFTALDAMADAQRAIAELREECERLRVKLMTIASAEPGRHNIEWAKAMAATGNNEAYAKWREAFDQRDKLAGLLADVKADYTHAIHWEDLHSTMKRIDAALAEVKPCQESPAPTT